VDKINNRRIFITEEISESLGLRYSAKQFFKHIESIPADSITVDFVDTKFISRSFAHEYLSRKKSSHKRIIEVNTPENINKMFRVVENSNNKRSRNPKRIKAVIL